MLKHRRQEEFLGKEEWLDALCDKAAEKAENDLDLIEGMLELELKSAKISMKKANLAGNPKGFDYFHGQAVGLGIALCCIRRARTMEDNLSECNEIVFFNEGRCGLNNFVSESDRSKLSLHDVVWELYKKLRSMHLEPAPTSVYDAFYFIADKEGYMTEANINALKEKPDKKMSDWILLREAMSCEEIARHGNKWYAKSLEKVYGCGV